MTTAYEEEAVSVEEYTEIKNDYDKVIASVRKAQAEVKENSMDEALDTLSDIETDCSICQGEIDDAKQKIGVVNELCNIEKTASDKRCQVMSGFILDNLSEFVTNINMALEDLRSEAYGQEKG
jgi:hypothetical protein